jgi:hypothetical protein
MLWGLAGLALPVLAHMVHRHTSKRLDFPSLRFIRITEIPRKGRNIPTDLLLLLLRLLLLASIVVCLAGPRYTDPSVAVAEPGTETVVFIDNSASMTGWDAPSEVRKTLDKLLNEIPGPLGVVTFTDNLPVSPQGRDFLQSYDATKSPLTHKDPQVALAKAVSLFTPGSTRRQLLVISDFQTSQWQLATAQLGSHGIEARLHPVAGDREGNLSVQNVRTSPAGTDKIRVWAQVANFTGKRLEVPVTLHTGEDSTDQTLTLDADQSGQVQFLLPRDEYLRGRITLGQDRYAQDNTFHFWMMAPPAAKVEFLLTPDKDRVGEEESFFLRTAILSSTRNEWQRYVVTHHTLGKEKEDATVEAVFIPGMDSHITTEQLEAARLHAFNGGKLVVTPGNSPAEMVTRLRDEQILSADYRGMQESTARGLEPFRVKGITESGPLAKTFGAQAAKDLYLAQVHKYLAIRPKGEGAETLLEMEDGTPLLLRSPIGAGNLFLFTTRFHSTWSDLPLRNSFLPVIREILSGYGEQQSRQWPALAIGGELLSEGSGPAPFQATEAGLFQWEDQLVAVNTAREESNPGVMSAPAVLQNLGASGAVQKRLGTSTVGQTAGLPDGDGVPLAKWFALAAILFLLAECFWTRPTGLPSEASP